MSQNVSVGVGLSQNENKFVQIYTRYLNLYTAGFAKWLAVTNNNTVYLKSCIVHWCNAKGKTMEQTRHLSGCSLGLFYRLSVLFGLGPRSHGEFCAPEIIMELCKRQSIGYNSQIYITSSYIGIGRDGFFIINGIILIQCSRNATTLGMWKR